MPGTPGGIIETEWDVQANQFCIRNKGGRTIVNPDTDQDPFIMEGEEMMILTPDVFHTHDELREALENILRSVSAPYADPDDFDDAIDDAADLLERLGVDL